MKKKISWLDFRLKRIIFREELQTTQCKMVLHESIQIGNGRSISKKNNRQQTGPSANLVKVFLPQFDGSLYTSLDSDLQYIIIKYL